MATRGRKPKAKEVKEFYINNEPTFNKAWQKKTNVFSSTAQFFNIFPKGNDEFYLSPVKKGERLGYGKYRIVGHYDNAKSDDRDKVMADRKSKDLFFKNPLTTPTRIKYDAYKGTYGYHLVTHDRDGKRVEVPIVGAFPNKQTGNFVATILADMNIPDASHKRSSKNRNKKGKIMSCPVNAGSLAISSSNPGKLKLVKKTPKAECAKYGNKSGFSPKEYERDYDPKTSSTKDAESTEDFLAESDLIYYYSAQGMEMDLSDYTAMDSVTVDDTSYQPAQHYGAEWMAEFCAGCGNHKRAEGCGCMGAESESATYEPSNEPDMASPATEPTNANFSAESWKETDENTIVTLLTFDLSIPISERVSEMLDDEYEDYDLPTLEWYLTRSFNGQGDWMTANFGKNDIEQALDMVHGRMGKPTKYGYGAESLEDFNGMESVVVEPPMGRGVAQWYSEENESAEYEPSSEPEGSTPATEPTNANFSAESKNRWVKGKDGKTYVLRKRTGRMVTHNAESSPSSFDITWEDAQGLSSPSLPPEGIHFAEGDSAIYEPSSEPEGSEPATEPTNENADLFGAECMNCKMAECMCAEYYDAQETLEDYTPMESVVVDDTSYQPAQNYGAEFEGEFTDSVKKGAGWGVGLALGYGLLTTGLIGLAELLGRRMNKGE